jgi:hypothetical protein
MKTLLLKMPTMAAATSSGSILISSALVPEDLTCVGEQEPNPVRRDGNQDDRKDKTR